MKRWMLGILTLLLIVPAAALADTSSVILGIDDANLYDGMQMTYSQGYSPTVANNVATIVLPLVTTGSISGSTITATPNLGSTDTAPFVFGNYQKSVPLSTQSVNNGTGTKECLLYPLRSCAFLRPEKRRLSGRHHGGRARFERKYDLSEFYNVCDDHGR